MHRNITWLCQAAIVLLVGVNPANAAPDDDNYPKLSAKAGRQTAEAWLQGVDAGAYSDSWDGLAPLLQQQQARGAWADTLSAMRMDRTKIVQRLIIGARFSRSLPEAPPGEYVVVQYETTFEGGETMTETVVPMRTPSGWRIAGYFLREYVRPETLLD